MAPLLALLSWSSAAVLLASFSLSPVSALSLNLHEARMSPNHAPLARRMSQHKRVKRCKPRASVPAAAPASTSSDAPQPTSSKPADDSQSNPAPPPPPKATSTSSKPKPTSAPTAGNPWSLCPNKKMLAWGDEAKYLSEWSRYSQRIYTWGATVNSDVQQYGVKACPMVWGEKNVDDFRDKVLNSDAAVDCALAVNEPEIPSQANMSPERAAQLWMELMVPLKQKKGTILGTPAVTSDTPTSEKWLESFFKACADQTGSPTCLADFLSLHYYDTSAQGFKDFLTEMHNKFNNLPVMVSEFADHNFNGAAQANAGQIWDFAGQMKDFFDNTDWIVCYAPFGAMPQNYLPDINPLNAIMDNSHQLTPLGNFYYN